MVFLQDVFSVYSTLPLFAGSAEDTLRLACERSQLLTVAKHERFTADSASLFVIIQGSVTVLGVSKHQPVTLNTLKQGQIFGAASLFGGPCGVTSMVAKEDCRCALLSQDTVEELLQRDPVFCKNYITFLSNKIRFLNRKIAFFTSGSATRKVAEYLLSLPAKNHVVDPGMNLSKLASTLDMGRASLYRALDTLEENGFITRNRTQITLVAPEELKQFGGTP